jgi:uncharacterized protein YgiM (DUF1202 family)
MLAKAAAGFAAASAFVGTGPVVEPVIAQEATTRAGDWWAPDGAGADGETLEFTADHSFRAIAPHWAGGGDLNGVVEIALSADGVTWTDPAVVGPALADAGPADRDGRVYGHLLMSDEAQYVRVRTLDANGAPAALLGLALTYIDASAGPTIDDIGSGEPAIGGELSRPPIISRAQWGANLAYDGWDGGTSGWSAEYRTVEHIIIHHSETPNFRDPLVEIRSIHYYHTVTRGWGDIGYNYLVDYLGNVYEGRKGGENVVGGHAYQYAYGSAGICSMGAFSLQTSTPEAIGALVWISAWAGRNLDLLGPHDFHQTPHSPPICGPRDVVNSSCPGDSLYADLPYIRTASADVLAGTSDADKPADYAAGDVVETTVDNANLRTKPGLKGSIDATLPKGKVLTIVEGPTTTDGYTWYRVSGEKSAGWLATSTFAPSASAAPAREYTNGSRVEVSTRLLNIRTEPGLSGSIVATLPQGDVATVVAGPEDHGNITWLKIDSNLGTGWVAEQYVAPSGRSWVGSSFTVGDSIRVSTDNLNMRTDATNRARVVAQLGEGTTGRVVDGPRKSAGVTWLKIETDQGSGWVSEEYLSDGDAPPPADPLFDVGDEIVVDTDSLNMRRDAGVKGSVMAVLWHGVTGTVIDPAVTRDGYTWYRIETDEGDGWVVETFLADAGSEAAPASGFEQGTAIAVTTDAVNLRNSPTTFGSVVTKLYNGDKGSVVGGTKQSDGYTWVETLFGDDRGWVATAFVGRSTGSPSYSGALAVGMTAEVTSDNVNVRPKASISASVKGQLFTGATVEIVDGPVEADGYTWFDVESSSWNGWTVAKWLAPTSAGSIAIGDSVRVFGGELNLRGGPSTSDGITRVLPDGAIVEVLDGPETANGFEWYRVSSSRYGTGWAVSAWLERA